MNLLFTIITELTFTIITQWSYETLIDCAQKFGKGQKQLRFDFHNFFYGIKVFPCHVSIVNL